MPALLRGAVSEGIWHHVSLRPLLQCVVAYGGCRPKRRIDIAWLENFPFCLRTARPHACETVSLQLDPHLELICLGLAHAGLHLLHLGQNAGKVLDMMADLVGDHISLRKLTGATADIAPAKSGLDLAKERYIKIHTRVIGT